MSRFPYISRWFATTGELDGERVDDLNCVLQPDGERVLQVGKRKFVKVAGS